jgi:uncharacterized membrane protein YfcA
MLIGVTKAGFGGGTGIVVTPLLIMVMPAKEAIGIMLPLLMMTDIMSMVYYWRKWDTPNVVALVPGAAVGILLGGTILRDIPELWLRKAIGIIALGFVIFRTWRTFRKAPRAADGAPHVMSYRYIKGVAAGIGAGVTSTLAHIGGVVVSMYLLPQGLTNRAYVGTATAVFFMINAMKIPVYFRLGILDTGILKQDLIYAPVLAIGVLTGILLNRRVSQKAFSYVILAIVLVSGTNLLLGINVVQLLMGLFTNSN